MRWWSFVATLVALSGCGSDGAREPRSIVLVTIDTLRADHLGSYGAGSQTPSLDALARAGVRFENVFAQSPLTLPSHSSILTGTYPTFHGVRDNGRFRAAGRYGDPRGDPEERRIRDRRVRLGISRRFPIRARPGLRSLRRFDGPIANESFSCRKTGRGCGSRRAKLDCRAGVRTSISCGSISSTPTPPTIRRIPIRTPTRARSPTSTPR